MLPEPPVLIYITGPMTGYPELNRPMFSFVEQKLLALGYPTINPSLGVTVDRQLAQQQDGMPAYDQRHGQPYRDGMRRNLQTILGRGPDSSLLDPAKPVEGMVLLPGWERSSGARFDALVGQQIGLTLMEWDRRNDMLVEPRFTVITMTRDNEPPGISAHGRAGHHCLRAAA